MKKTEKYTGVTEMDNTRTGTEREEKKRGGGFFSTVIRSVKNSLTHGRDSASAPLLDAVVLASSFLVARCHVIFGAYPIALGLIAVLPTRVWFAVIGASLGALTLGKAGIIYAMISVIVAFLRVIISATDKPRGADSGTLFGEVLLLRMASAVVGGFVAAVYEMLLSGFSLISVLFGVSMVILPAIICFALSGLFDTELTPELIFLGKNEIFSVKNKTEKEKFNIIFFQCSALLSVFLLSLSFEQYELLGVSAGYVFAGIATIFTARRLGAVRGAVVGFVSAVGLSSTQSVAFALAGLAVGALNSLGIVFGAVGGAVALCMWSAYSGGLLGLLTTLPEYAIAAVISVPLFKKTRLEHTEDNITDAGNLAEDMVGTMALSYKSRYLGSLGSLESAFTALSSLTGRARVRDGSIKEAEVTRVCTECVGRYFDTEEAHIPAIFETRATFIEKIPNIATIVYKNGKITPQDIDTPLHLAPISASICESINRAMAIIVEERYRERCRDTAPEDFAYMAKLINEARLGDKREKTANERLEEIVRTHIKALGVDGFAVRVFGERAPHFIIATEDALGEFITSPILLSGIERESGLKLGAPEFYRRGKMALMECGTAPSYSATSAAALVSADGSEVSGDVTRAFSTEEERYFSLMSDGMGSGEEARETSEFVADFLTRTLEFGRGVENSLRLLNNIIKRRRAECSATVDLFSLDLITGEAMFYKCGSAPSYVKRGSSLYRIRSRTSPLGVLSELDAERIRVELEDGDYIIMFSDGVSPDGESPWLLEALAEPADQDTERYARAILEVAKENSESGDDMSVMVTRINRRP